MRSDVDAEVEEKVRDLLEPDEQVVRKPIRAKHSWLALTDHRLLMLDANRRGHPRELLAAEPLDQVQVERRWLWSKLTPGLSIRATDGLRSRILLKPARGTRTRAGMERALRDVAHDVQLWTRVAAVTEQDAAAGHKVDTAFALVHARALEARTPAQLARYLGLQADHVGSVLSERFGVHVSKGAATGYTYTAQDRRQFDDTVKEKLFLALVDEYGAEALVTQAGEKFEWWESSTAGAVESLLDVVDVKVGHVSTQRAPIARWESRTMALGLVGALLATMLSVGLLFFIPVIWRKSNEQWRAGETDRPASAISIGVGTAVVLALAVIAAVVALVLSGVSNLF